jgi:hypothetical protein
MMVHPVAESSKPVQSTKSDQTERLGSKTDGQSRCGSFSGLIGVASILSRRLAYAAPMHDALTSSFDESVSRWVRYGLDPHHY